LRTSEIWTTGADHAPLPTRTQAAVWLSHASLDRGEPSPSSPPHDSVMLLPTGPSGRTCGVALVPDESKASVLLNGVRLRPGMHVLHHADRVSLNGRAAWFAIAAAPDEVLYKPQLHGDAVFCHRTKARLTAGDPMVICGGTPEASCGMMFTAVAWEARIPCHSCGALPGAPRWQPPPSEDRGSLTELLELADGV
jgi:hypothetical protein